MPTELETLVQRLERHNAEYRAGTPTIADAAYDALVEELRASTPNTPISSEWKPRLSKTNARSAIPSPCCPRTRPIRVTNS